MKDIQRQKYLKLMVEIEELEAKIEELEQKKAAAKRASPARDQKLVEAQEKLGALRTELTRVSDGCGTPHTRN